MGRRVGEEEVNSAQTLRTLPGELIGVPDTTLELLEIARRSATHDTKAFHDLLRRCGCSNPEGVFQDLTASGFFNQRNGHFAISTTAYKTLLFLSGALGSRSEAVVDELRSIEPTLQRYELVREGMTSRFIKGLLNEPGFQRIYISSPWINLVKEDLGRLAVALDKAAKSLSRPPEILVLAQTPKDFPEMERTLEILKKLGASVIEKPTLHSKLYMREPGPSGGLSLAIVGSENLTRPKWIELGIEIRNDSYILSKLRNYFFDIFGRQQGE